MKRAVVRQRRRDNAGRELVCVVCPVCDGRHWLTAATTGTCPRRGGRFAVVAVTRSPKRATS